MSDSRYTEGYIDALYDIHEDMKEWFTRATVPDTIQILSLYMLALDKKIVSAENVKTHEDVKSTIISKITNPQLLLELEE